MVIKTEAKLLPPKSTRASRRLTATRFFHQNLQKNCNEWLLWTEKCMYIWNVSYLFFYVYVLICICMYVCVLWWVGVICPRLLWCWPPPTSYTPFPPTLITPFPTALVQQIHSTTNTAALYSPPPTSVSYNVSLCPRLLP